MSPLQRTKCDICTAKIPKHQPRLVCDICSSQKHLKCQGLTKSDVRNLSHQRTWTCFQCISSILPVNACVINRSKKRVMSNENVDKKRFKSKCGSCNGYSYSEKNVRKCNWCDKNVHSKCWRGILGCNSCCDSMIPGASVFNHELTGDYNFKNNVMYNPYHNSHMTMQLGDLINNEASNDTWNEISDFLIKCQYKQPNKKSARNNELDILSLNVRSLTKFISYARENTELFEHHDILCLNETNCLEDKLPNGLNDITIENFYEPLIKSPVRDTGRGGGLAIYVNKRVCDEANIETFDPNPEPLNTSGEFQFIKIKHCKGTNKTFILGNVYRSPSRKPDSFNKLYDLVLNKLNRHSKKLVYIVGDFNQDLIKYEQDINSQNLTDIASNHGFVQIVSRPTRITDHSATLIDHVYTNSLDSTISCNIITHDISDHLATNTKISLESSGHNFAYNLRNISTEDCNKERRIFNEANNHIFEELIGNETWDGLTDDMDAQTKYDKFSETYMKHYNTAYPLKSNRTRRENERANPKPWILPWLEEACARKQNHYHNFVKEPSPENKTLYDKWSAFCTKHVNKAKAKYYKKYFDEYQDNSRKQWQMINNLLNRSRKKNSIKRLVKEDGSIVNTPLGMAETFNEYFTNIAANLKQTTGYGPGPHMHTHDHTDYLHDPAVNSIYLKPSEPSEVYEIINNFKNKATLDCKISVLKIANKNFRFTTTLSNVINSSLDQGTFPQQLKTARVVPIHKGGDKCTVSNYRPISLLTSFSKIYEKIMHNRMLSFLQSNNSLFEAQYGFRPGRSCEHAILNAQNILLNSLNSRQISLLLLIDYSKAFDMVDHEILATKLEHYGIRGKALDWMKSYLQDRSQFVSVDGTDSSAKPLRYGVPQGSILGPLLFIIYINDLPGISNIARFIMYADDANIIITADSISEINNLLRELCIKLVHWVKCNGLALNLKKTNYMIFSRQKVELPEPFTISNVVIERKTEARFLGVIFDEKLNWTSHIKHLKSKMCRYIGVMYKLKRYLPPKVRLQIFHSFIQSHVNYCSLVWGFSSKTNIEAIFSQQKKGIRAIAPGFINYNYKDGELPGHTKPYFTQFKILTVHGIIALNALTFMHKAKHFPNSLPSSLRNTIPDNAPTLGSNHETAESWLAAYNNKYYRPSLFYKGPMIATMPEVAQQISPACLLKIKIYKNNIKTYILKVQANGDENEWLSHNNILSNIPGLRKSDRIATMN